MFPQIDELRQQALDELEAVQDAESLEQFRVRHLGAKGSLKQLMKRIQEVDKQDKPAFGQQANALKEEIQKAYEQKKSALGDGAGRAARGPALDLTEPGLPPFLGRSHPLTEAIEQLQEVFGRMGFDTAQGPEVEDVFHNFAALNIPQEHPARDPLDNFYLAAAGNEEAPLLRTQTSTVQIRVLENQAPPVRVVSPGRVYRPDEHDATHSSMFHQLEGLYVDEGVTLADLKTALHQFVKAYFGPEAEMRLVPSYFPFTEPSAELYVHLPDNERAAWLELGGCGMVDPAVFEHVGCDPEKWSGFAFGFGIERLVMLKRGVTDIRDFFENDARFLKQF